MTVDVAKQAARRGRRGAACVAAGFVIAAGSAMIALHWLDRDAGIGTWWAGSLTIGVGLGAFGSLLAYRLPDNPIGWLMIVGGIAQLTTGLGREWTVFAAVTHDGQLPGATFGAWIGGSFLISIATLPLTLLVFPDGRLPSPRWRPVVWVTLGALAVGSVASMLIAGPYTDELPGIVNPTGVDSPLIPLTVILSELVMIGAVVAAVVSLIHRARGATGVLHQQVKWVTFAAAVLGADLVLELVPFGFPPVRVDWLGPVALCFFLFSITVSVLRWRLWDIDVLISRSLVYGTSTLLLGAVFVGIVALSGRLRGRPVDYGSSMLAAAAVAVAFAPVRDHLQHRIDRRLYGDRHDPYRAMQRLGDQLGVPGTDDSILRDVADGVAASLRLDHVAILDEHGATMASIGLPRPNAQSFPLVFRTGVVGTLRVVRHPGTPLGQRDTAVLAGLTPLVAVVVHTVAITDALTRSRHALVSTREEERLRIRRDLHDGLGPALAAIRMKIDGAHMLIDSDPQRSKDVLDQLSDDVRATIADIRHLVDDLRPPALDELGLASALRELARSFSGPTGDGRYLTVKVDIVGEFSSLRAACEVAVFRIVSESLNNVLRHAKATLCRIRVDASDPAELRVSVDDDGLGGALDDGCDRRGIGIHSMMERAAELDGDLCVERSPLGGTRVRARLPTGVDPRGELRVIA